MPRGKHANSQTTKATLGLRELLLDGAFKPRERVPELRLVEELGVSRTPLRTALMTLEHEGLLETLPGGGFVVREFTRTDIDDAIELRGVLEGTAARLAAERLESEDELEPLRDCCRGMDAIVRTPSIETFMEYLRLNEEFHDAFRALAKSPQLGRALEHAARSPVRAAERPADGALGATRVVGDPARGAAPASRARRRDRPARGSACGRDRARACAHRTPEPRRRAREPPPPRAPPGLDPAATPAA